MRLPFAIFVLVLNGCSFATTVAATAAPQGSDWPKTTCSLPAGPQQPQCNMAVSACSVTCEAGPSHAVCTPAALPNVSGNCNNDCRCSY